MFGICTRFLFHRSLPLGFTGNGYLRVEAIQLV